MSFLGSEQTIVASWKLRNGDINVSNVRNITYRGMKTEIGKVVLEIEGGNKKKIVGKLFFFRNPSIPCDLL